MKWPIVRKASVSYLLLMDDLTVGKEVHRGFAIEFFLFLFATFKKNSEDEVKGRGGGQNQLK